MVPAAVPRLAQQQHSDRCAAALDVGRKAMSLLRVDPDSGGRYCIWPQPRKWVFRCECCERETSAVDVASSLSDKVLLREYARRNNQRRATWGGWKKGQTRKK